MQVRQARTEPQARQASGSTAQGGGTGPRIKEPQHSGTERPELEQGSVPPARLLGHLESSHAKAPGPAAPSPEPAFLLPCFALGEQHGWQVTSCVLLLPRLTTSWNREQAPPGLNILLKNKEN